ncbi:MAG: hypothetical protein ABIQ47_16100 [Tepidiformaceae bacterium]
MTCSQTNWGQVGIPLADRKVAGEVFLANLRAAGLVQEFAGAEKIISIEHRLEDLPNDSDPSAKTSKPPVVAHVSGKAEELNSNGAGDTDRDSSPRPIAPTVHIDVQVHIPPDASAEQLDAIFASMAKHFYRA